MQSRSQEFLSGSGCGEAGAPLVRDVLRRFGGVRVRAHGGSMRPAIASGDVLTVRHGRRPVLGDVVLFERDGRLFAHRVVARTGCGRVRTRGDAHWSADPWVAADDVLGVVESVTSDGETRRCPDAPGTLATLWSRLRG